MYPTLVQTVKQMMNDADPGVRYHPVEAWPWPDDAKLLEDQANSLTEQQRDGILFGTHGTAPEG